MRFLGFFFGRSPFFILSKIVYLVLRIKGVRIGRNFYVESFPVLKIRGAAKNIIIGDNVAINGRIDLRNRENGVIEIKSNVRFDDNCRLVAANSAKLFIAEGADIGPGCILNAGADIVIGPNCLVAGYNYFQSSNHRFDAPGLIKDLGYTYGKIVLEEGCWLGAGVVVTAGAVVRSGAIVAANAVVTCSVEENAIYGGVPAKFLKYRF